MGNPYFFDDSAINSPLRVNGYSLKFPFVWFTTSNVEKTDFQKTAFNFGKIDGLLSSLAELGENKRKEEMLGMLNYFKKRKTPIKLDSGGFTYYKKGLDPDPKQILSDQLKHSPDVVVQLDRPLNPTDSTRDRKKKINISLKNYDEVAEEVTGHTILVPTIHGWTDRELNASIKGIKRINSDPSYISVGSLVPLLTSRYGNGISKELGGRKRVFEIIKKVRTEFPQTPLHVLGAGGALTPILMGLGVDSIDTSGWIKKAAFGAVIFKGTSDRFFRRMYGRTYIFDDEDAKEKWKKCKCNVCKTYRNQAIRFFKFEAKTNDARLHRAAHNVCIQKNDIEDARNAIINNEFEEYLVERMKNSNYRKDAEQLFGVKIEKGKKSRY